VLHAVAAKDLVDMFGFVVEKLNVEVDGVNKEVSALTN
jgi:hypothetical protein